MPELRYFFDTSAFLAIIRKEPNWKEVADFLDSLRRNQRVTSVLVAYELYRGVHPASRTRKAQLRELDAILGYFSLKPVYEAQAMLASKVHYKSKGSIDPILAAQCLDGGYTLVTMNVKDFERVPGIRLLTF
ncbi:MAG: type II toxin-antitoxin system VapC family toxin [Burkholderiales bacterium]|nr:type II toxin-antitoxin system VapC family toxin [Burkholderiales bacterium]MBK9346993.1 type II toxin-antitoxin system VapC family toxin [Burkholderiales bacterium]